MNKTILLVIVLCLLFLSYIQINAGVQRKAEEVVDVTYFNFLFLPIFFCFFVFSFFYVRNRLNLLLWLMLGYFVLGYLESVSFSFRNIFYALQITFWVFCFSFGCRLVYVNNRLSSYFINSINIIIVLPLSLYCIVRFFTNNMYLSEFGTDAFFGIIVYLPFVLMLEEKRALKVILYLLLIVIAILSLKRSMIIGVFACSLVYALFIDHRKLFSKWYFWLLLVGGVVSIYYLYNLVSETLFFRFSNLTEDGGSGRDVTYQRIITALHNSDLSSLVFGHGYQSVLSINDWMLAHNDFLQLLYDYGLVGFGLYFLFLLSMVFQVIKRFSKRSANKTLYAAFSSSLILFLVLSLLNCFIYSVMFIAPIMLALGILDSKVRDSRKYFCNRNEKIPPKTVEKQKSGESNIQRVGKSTKIIRIKPNFTVHRAGQTH